MNGIVVVNKPKGMTSHDVVSRVRRILKFKKIGHAGTLDPLATGVLVILVGPSTKLFNKFVSFDKAYTATLRLGMKTTTADIEGEVISQMPVGDVSRENVEEIFGKFTGEIDQIPPMVSAVKHQGQRLYQLARKGIEVVREPRKVRIDELRILKYAVPDIQFYLECSKGTYVRKIAEDVGDLLGCGACITQIERTKVGPFRIEDAVNLEELNASHLRNWQGESTRK